MVSVEMGYKNGLYALCLATIFCQAVLGTFPAIDQANVFMNIHQLGRGMSPIRRERGTASQDEDVKTGHKAFISFDQSSLLSSSSF